MNTTQIVIAVPLLSLLALATSIDLADRRIPNGLSFGGAAAGLIVQATLFGPIGVAAALVGWVVCLVCFMPLYATGGMAAGDVKLMAMVGAFLGPLNGFVACICSLIAGAGFAAAALAWRRVQRRFAPPSHAVAAEHSVEQNTRDMHTIEKIPYAAAIALGATVAASQPAWLSSVLPAGVLP